MGRKKHQRILICDTAKNPEVTCTALLFILFILQDIISSVWAVATVIFYTFALSLSWPTKMVMDHCGGEEGPNGTAQILSQKNLIFSLWRKTWSELIFELRPLHRANLCQWNQKPLFQEIKSSQRILSHLNPVLHFCRIIKYLDFLLNYLHLSLRLPHCKFLLLTVNGFQAPLKGLNSITCTATDCFKEWTQNSDYSSSEGQIPWPHVWCLPSTITVFLMLFMPTGVAGSRSSRSRVNTGF